MKGGKKEEFQPDFQNLSFFIFHFSLTMKQLLLIFVAATVLSCVTSKPAPVNAGYTSEAQMRRNYEALSAKREGLEKQIAILNNEMFAAKNQSAAKKIRKEINALQNEYDITLRMLTTYPLKITNPEVAKAQVQTDRAEFARVIEQKTEQKMAAVDQDKEAVKDVSDPELRRAYEKYQRQGELPDASPQTPSLTTYFTVQIGSGKGGQARTFKGLGAQSVEEKRVGTTSVYIVGQYSTREQADDACRDIRSKTKYKDAFIAAFSGERKISLTEAAHLLR